MLTAIVVALVTVIGAGTIALVIAYMDRRQVRQIEAHRLDPSVPLRPPPNAFRRFLVRRGLQLWCLASIAWYACTLHSDVLKQGPITRGEILSIALHVAAVITLVGALLLDEVLRRAGYIAERHFDLMKRVFEDIDSVTAIQRKMASDLAKRKEGDV